MGLFRVPLEVGDPQGKEFRTVSALVDTGAIYTSVPGSVLRALGVTPHTEREFILANGQHIRRAVGRTWVRLEGQVEMTLVIFGNEASETLLGVYTLEAFGLAADPVNRRLIAVPGTLLAMAGSRAGSAASRGTQP